MQLLQEAVGFIVTWQLQSNSSREIIQLQVLAAAVKSLKYNLWCGVIDPSKIACKRTWTNLKLASFSKIKSSEWNGEKALGKWWSPDSMETVYLFDQKIQVLNHR